MSEREEEILKDFQQQLAKIPVKDFILHFLASLATLAYHRMGIYQEGKAVDLSQAKLAVDIYGTLTDLLEKELSAAEKKALQNVLSSLRLSYVKKASEKDQTK